MNHKEFGYNFKIMNDNADSHAVVRVFLCPRKDNQGIVFSFDEGRWHCIEMDKFWHHLTGGENVISRKSSESSVTVPDIPSFSKLIHDADAAVANGAELHNEHLPTSAVFQTECCCQKERTKEWSSLLLSLSRTPLKMKATRLLKRVVTTVMVNVELLVKNTLIINPWVSLWTERSLMTEFSFMPIISSTQ